jgi:DNA polymerase epsilon subunit 2
MPLSAMNRRRQLVRTCKKHGLHVQPAALQAMMKQNDDDDDESLVQVLQFLQQKLARASPKIVTQQLWEQAVQDCLAKEEGSKRSSNHQEWRITDAFDTPKLVFDSLRQQFHYAPTSRERASLIGTVDDRLDMTTQRYLRVQQRVARKVSLTSVDRLLGTNAASAQLLLGLLQSTGNGGFELEDLTGTIPLQLSAESHLDASGVYMEGCLVLVQGKYDTGTFIVNRLGMPPLEAKSQSQPYLPSSPKCTNPTTPLTMYSMANVDLNNVDVVQQLEDLVEQLIAEDEEAILVLMGNFTTENMSLAVACDELARILEPLPATHHSVLIVPGPNDTPSMCWPLPPLKSQVLSSLENVQLVSNPCRLDYGDKQVLLFRQDMIRQHAQHQILQVRSETTMATRVLHTVLSQGHLLPQAPIYWNFDHAMSVYPVPDLLLVGLEEGDQALEARKSQCHVVAPGSEGQWAKVTLGQRGHTKIDFSQDESDITTQDNN